MDHWTFVRWADFYSQWLTWTLSVVNCKSQSISQKSSTRHDSFQNGASEIFVQWLYRTTGLGSITKFDYNYDFDYRSRKTLDYNYDYLIKKISDYDYNFNYTPMIFSIMIMIICPLTDRLRLQFWLQVSDYNYDYDYEKNIKEINTDFISETCSAHIYKDVCLAHTCHKNILLLISELS
jgi:hypothetical protein